MKRRLLTLLLLTAGIWLGVEAQLLRQDAGEYITAPTAKMTTADAKVRIKAGALPGSTIRLHRSAPQRSLGTLKGTFQGVMTYPQASAGLYSFDHTGRKTAIWTSGDGVVLNAGFIADDILYAFYRQSSTSGAFRAYGSPNTTPTPAPSSRARATASSKTSTMWSTQRPTMPTRAWPT